MAINIYYDIKQALNLNNPSKRRYSKYSKMYILTTENINGYYRKLNFKNKRVLTVTSSFDHALNAILYGSKKITTFDINKLSFHMANLKIAAVKTLTYEEFIDFFLSPKVFSYEIYKKIRMELNCDFDKFFEGIYKHFEYNGSLIRKSYLFHHGHKSNVEDNTYLTKNNYYILKDKINDTQIDFINTSITNLTKCIKDEKYDLILLSNISDYAESIFKKDYLKKYFTFIENSVTKLLNENGLIAVAYIYDYDSIKEGRSDINIESKRNELLTKEYRTLIFKSTIKNLKNDGIILYKKGGNALWKVDQVENQEE